MWIALIRYLESIFVRALTLSVRQNVPVKRPLDVLLFTVLNVSYKIVIGIFTLYKAGNRSI